MIPPTDLPAIEAAVEELNDQQFPQFSRARKPGVPQTRPGTSSSPGRVSCFWCLVELANRGQAWSWRTGQPLEDCPRHRELGNTEAARAAFGPDKEAAR